MCVLNDIFLTETILLSDRHLNKKPLALGFSEHLTNILLYSVL